MSQENQVAVIGAGIVGMCAALNLQERGRHVVLLDPLGVAQDCTWGSGGLINPDAHLPVAMPGMIRNVPRWLLDPLAPLSVRPADALRATPFLLRWLLASRSDAVRRGVDALRALHRNALDEYRSLLGEAYSRHIIQRGGVVLMPGDTPSPAERLGTALRDELGIVAEVLDREGLERLVPGMAPFARRGLFFASNAHTPDPEQLCVALSEKFVGQGGDLRRIRVDRIVSQEGGCALVHGGGRIEVAQVVIAAGARTPKLLRDLGVSLPLVAERGYHLQLIHPSIQLRLPMIYRAGGFAITPMEGGLRLGGTVEIASVDAPPNYARAEALWERVAALFPGLEIEERRPWMGSRPALPDSVPAIGRLAGFPQVAVAVGHGHDGMIGAPATGRLVAELITDGTPHIDPKPYRPERFNLFS